MTTKPDTIKISVTSKEEINATHADLHVTVKGTSFFSGDEAMKKAKEVNQLVSELNRAGIKDEAVTLQGVRTEGSSGALLKSSSAVYRLKVRCEKLNQLAEILDVVSVQKNASLDRIEWKYDDESEKEKVLTAALEKAKAKAEKVAASLNVKLLGVYDFIENAYDHEVPPVHFAAQSVAKSSAVRSAPAPSLSMEIQHSKTINVTVDVWYRVSEFKS